MYAEQFVFAFVFKMVQIGCAKIKRNFLLIRIKQGS